jgi:hypothetical protein
LGNEDWHLSYFYLWQVFFRFIIKIGWVFHKLMFCAMKTVNSWVLHIRRLVSWCFNKFIVFWVFFFVLTAKRMSGLISLYMLWYLHYMIFLSHDILSTHKPFRIIGVSFHTLDLFRRKIILLASTRLKVKIGHLVHFSVPEV